ncbi:MAG: hypothetical protein R6V57_09515 [Vicinamibacterales bacterium]
MTRLRTRRARREDAEAIAESYRRVRKRPLAAERLAWAFEDAPAGPGHHWVVESEGPDGAPLIVGHHGLAPLRFRWMGEDVVVGKTTKTLVLPEFRPHLLYLRFERDCLLEAEASYDATYSVGPGAARFRGPLGYGGEDRMVVLERALLPPGLVWRAAAGAPSALQSGADPWVRPALRVLAAVHTRPSLQLEEIPAAEAAASPFFDDLGRRAECPGVLSPSRTPADLAWRFWDNPLKGFIALAHTWAGGAKGCCIMNMALPWRPAIDDLVLTDPRPDLLEPLLDSVFRWAARRGALAVSFTTSTTGQPPELLECVGRLMRPALRGQLAACGLRKLAGPVDEMPRRVTPRGRSAGLTRESWQVSRFLRPL